MAELLAADDVFVYMGGQQVVPEDVTHVIIDRSVNIIPEGAFARRGQLVSVKFHDGVEQIKRWAFIRCRRLRGIKLLGVREVEGQAFMFCDALADVQFGDKLETIQSNAFVGCALRSIKLPSVRSVQSWAFGDCLQLTNVEMPDVERIERFTFNGCRRLTRIVIPLKDNLMEVCSVERRGYQFDEFVNLTSIDLVGRVHVTISSLLLESWRDDMNQEIDRINQTLPKTRSSGKAAEISNWMQHIIARMEYYKTEHNRLLKEHMTQLELALWKAKIDEKEKSRFSGKVQARKADSDEEKQDIVKNELRVTCGASIIIRNVLSFLKLE